MKARSYIALIVISKLLLTSPTFAVGQLPQFPSAAVDVHGTFDIGEPTRRLIEAYPKEFEQAIVDTVLKIMPELQQNLDIALKKLNDSIDEQRLKTSCFIQGNLSASHDDKPIVLIPIKGEPLLPMKEFEDVET
jgi:hypothetical protein